MKKYSRRPYRQCVNTTGTLLLLAVFGVFGQTQAADTALPDIKLAGVVDFGDGMGQAIVSIGGSERILALGESIGAGWRLTEVHRDYVVLSDENNNTSRLRINSVLSESGELAAAAVARRVNAIPIEVHTPDLYPDLESGQRRRFFVPPPEAVALTADPVLDEWQPESLRIDRPGQARRFSPEPAPMAEQDDIEMTARGGSALEPGQSIRFGPIPPVQQESDIPD